MSPRPGAVIEERAATGPGAARNAAIAASPESRTGGHLHVFVDRRLVRIPRSTDVELSLEPGHNRITV